MNLTPLDVRRKQFDKGFRGYDPTEVDLFLKQVADRLEDIQDEARRAEERQREAESKLTHYEKVELALQEALESARETARRSEASAEERARLIVQEAELRAERIVHDAERERHGLRQDLVRLNSRQAEVAARLRGFLLSELEVLAQFQGDDPVGFIKLQSAGSGAISPSHGALPSPQARLEAPIDPPPADSREDAAEADRVDAERVPDRRGDAGPSPVQAPPSVESPAPAEAPAPEPVSETPLNAPLDPEPLVTPLPAESVWAPPASDAPAESADPSVTGAFSAGHDPAERPASPASASESAPPEPRPEESDAVDPAPPDPAPPASETPTPPPARTGGWDLRSLVTGEDRNVAASDEERERIRRILDDLD